MFSVPIYSFYLILLVIILLISGSVISYRLQQKHPDKDYKELRQRVQSWWMMIGILFAALLFNQTLAIIFFGFLSFIALKEFLSIVPTRQTDRRVIFLGLSVDSRPVLLGFHGLVWHVYYFYSGLCLSVAAGANGAIGGN